MAFQDPQAERRSRNERHLGAVYCARNARFEVVHGLLDRVMRMLGAGSYRLDPIAADSDVKTFLPGRGARIMYTPPADGAAAESRLMDSDSAPADRRADAPSSTSPLQTLKSALGTALPSREVEIGVIGVLHPSVLAAFEITYPCSALELNVQALL